MASKDQNAIVEISEIDLPDTTVSAKEAFDLDLDMEIPAFSKKTEYVPDFDDTYCFDHDTTLAIAVAFAHNRRLLIQGYHGTGKSTHVEQVAARLNGRDTRARYLELAGDLIERLTPHLMRCLPDWTEYETADPREG